MGIFYQIGGVEKDEIKAFDCYKKLVEKDDVNVQFQLGCCYNEGIGIEVNKEKAFELYRIAAEKGHITAQIILVNHTGMEKYKKEFKKSYLLV